MYAVPAKWIRPAAYRTWTLPNYRDDWNRRSNDQYVTCSSTVHTLCNNSFQFSFGQGDPRAVRDQTILYETFAVSHFLGRRHLNTNAGRASGHLLLIYTCLVGTIATKLLCSSTANFGRLLPLPSIPVFSFYDKLDSRNLMEAAAVRRILPCLSKDNIGYTHCTDALSLANNLPLH